MIAKLVWLDESFRIGLTLQCAELEALMSCYSIRFDAQYERVELELEAEQEAGFLKMLAQRGFDGTGKFKIEVVHA